MTEKLCARHPHLRLQTIADHKLDELYFNQCRICDGPNFSLKGAAE